MEILKDFGVEPILLLAQTVNFIILLVVLTKFLYKPILKVLEERKKKIETSLKQAEEINKNFEVSAQKQAEILDKAREDAAKIISDAKEEAKLLAEKMLSDAAVNTENTIARTKEMLGLEKTKMMSEAKKEMAEIIALAAEKVASKSISASDREKLVNEALAEMKES